MTGQKEKRQHRFVDLVRVKRHPRTVPVLFDLRRGLRRMRTIRMDLMSRLGLQRTVANVNLSQLNLRKLSFAPNCCPAPPIGWLGETAGQFSSGIRDSVRSLGINARADAAQERNTMATNDIPLSWSDP